MTKLVLLLLLIAKLLTAPTITYTSQLTCMTCKNITGCPGNVCLRLIGEITAEYCYGRSSCLFTKPEYVTFASCGYDVTLNNCSSKICMNGLTSNTCISRLGGGCYQGAILNTTYNNRYLMMNLSYPNKTQIASDSLYFNQDSTWSQAYGTYSQCIADIYGGMCDCCASLSFTMNGTFLGYCVPEYSPLAKVLINNITTNVTSNVTNNVTCNCNLTSNVKSNPATNSESKLAVVPWIVVLTMLTFFI